MKINESDELERLKAYAYKLGYKLVKIPDKVTLLPCPVCGRKNTGLLYFPSGQFRKCNNCGFEGKVVAKGELATKKAWNEAVEDWLSEKEKKNAEN